MVSDEDSQRAATMANQLPLEQLSFDEETKSCWLRAITDRQDSHFVYTIEFDGSRYNWEGRIFVPDHEVTVEMRNTWHNYYNKPPRGPGQGLTLSGPLSERQGRVNFYKITSEAVHRNRKYYVRKMEVKMGRNIYKGEAYIPKHEFNKQIWAARKAYAENLLLAWEQEDAFESIEEVPAPVEGRYSVQFETLPVKGRRAQVEVWDQQGQELFEGKVSIVSMVKNGETRLVCFKCSDRAGEPLYLEGDLIGEMKHGRFLCVGFED